MNPKRLTGQTPWHQNWKHPARNKLDPAKKDAKSVNPLLIVGGITVATTGVLARLYFGGILDNIPKIGLKLKLWEKNENIS